MASAKAYAVNQKQCQYEMHQEKTMSYLSNLLQTFFNNIFHYPSDQFRLTLERADPGYFCRRGEGTLAYYFKKPYEIDKIFVFGGEGGSNGQKCDNFKRWILSKFQTFKTSGWSAADEADGEELHAEDAYHSVQENATTVRYRHIRLSHHDEFLRPGSGARLHPKTRARRRAGNNAQKRNIRR